MLRHPANTFQPNTAYRVLATCPQSQSAQRRGKNIPTRNSARLWEQ
jgi:hypothetical protein